MDKPGKTVKRKRPRRTFTPEFKAEAVRLCRVGDRSIAQVAKDLDLTETALREWVHRADVDAGKGPAGALTSDERAELARLRREIKQLQMERDILKKAAVVSTVHCNTSSGQMTPKKGALHGMETKSRAQPGTAPRALASLARGPDADGDRRGARQAAGLGVRDDPRLGRLLAA
jgi:transposase